MNIVSFKVAKTLKEVGYPQYGSCDEYYNQEGRVIDKFCDINKLIYPAPTYLDVWLWLWKAKGIWLPIKYHNETFAVVDEINMIEFYSKNDPKDLEEAIITAIDYFVDNNLIK